jgi:hypothetical protein
LAVGDAVVVVDLGEVVNAKFVFKTIDELVEVLIDSVFFVLKFDQQTIGWYKHG